jgi:UDP-N-acetylglucosamine 1-carboxyvinyltransferase
MRAERPKRELKMECFRITGGRRLHGTARVGGSKNASLPIMAAAILADGPVRLREVPHLTDVDTLGEVLGGLGLRVQRDSNDVLAMETVDSRPVHAGYDAVRRMRASFCVLGPLLARRGKAVVSLPGGCNIGPRPVDLHLKGLAALGAEIAIERGYVFARAKRLRGTTIDLTGPSGPTVTGTANVLSAAVLADGETTLRGAAIEPEIADLARFLNMLGAKIEGIGSSTLRITGVRALGEGQYRVIPDRIEAATLLLAGAITLGDVTATHVVAEHLAEVVKQLRAAGAHIEVQPDGELDRITIESRRRPRPLALVALPYPALPSDLQAQWMAYLAGAQGASTIADEVFPGRFIHVAELNRLAADIRLAGNVAHIRGVGRLVGARVKASDLRASAALVLAGLAAEGETVVERSEHLDRGYERLDAKLSQLGASVERIESQPTERRDDPHEMKPQPHHR